VMERWNTEDEKTATPTPNTQILRLF